ncbi:MAG TPA: metalloregulator ArsR/SmtB family transcription factor [Chthonomonadaceae bacterium]|nr:metalloregulator ArsR/SmtB family transcription factor [Chthonomonadaceae bacterium]
MSRHQATHDVFAAIADPTRRAILQRLGAGEQPVMALAEQFDVTLSAISQHIRILREVGLVLVRKEGRERIYRLNAAPLQTVAEWVRLYEPFWNEKLTALGDYLDRTATDPVSEPSLEPQCEPEAEREETI